MPAFLSESTWARFWARNWARPRMSIELHPRSLEEVKWSSSGSEEVTRSKRSVAAEDQFDSECLRSQNSISNLGSQGDTEVSNFWKLSFSDRMT